MGVCRARPRLDLGTVNAASFAGPGVAMVVTLAQVRASDPAPQPPGAACLMTVISAPQSGRLGHLVYVNGRYGQFARQFVVPRNPQSPEQQRNRSNFAAVASRWRMLTPEQRFAWCLAAASKYITTRAGRKVPLTGYHYFVSVNNRRAFLGLPQFDLPPAEPSFSPNPVAELVATNSGGTVSLKLRVPSPPAQYTLVQGAAPVSAGVSCVQHFPFLGLLPPPTDGWTDITALYAARYGLPAAGTVVFIRTCQHIDGWADVPKLTSALISAPT